MSASATTQKPFAINERKAGVFLKDAGGLPPVKDYYEGAVWKWGDRSWIPQAIQDARLDANAMSRKELLRKSRYFAANNGIYNSIADKWAQYTVGDCGLCAVSASPDANDYFRRWSQDCDALGMLDFGALQGLSSKGWFTDGESFIVRTVVKGRLKVQLVEAHRCYTPPQLASEEGVSVIDGVAVDKNGRVRGFYFNVGNESPYQPDEEKWQLVSAEDVHHVFEPERAGQYRGLPACTPVLNDLNDLDDLQMLTMQVAKQAATIGNVTTNRTGELSTQEARRTLLKINTINAGGSPVTKNASEYYQVKLGASEIALQHGDSIKQFQADRPSLAEREYWEYLTFKICAGIGISKMLVMPTSMQGTVARADLDVAAAFFRARSAVMQKAVACVFRWVCEWAQQFDREVWAGGFNFEGYQNVIVRPPRAPNVDVGRNSKALIEEIGAHIRTYQDEFASQGQDWREQFRKMKEAQEFAEEIGLKLAPQADQQAEPDEDEAEDGEENGEGEETKKKTPQDAKR